MTFSRRFAAVPALWRSARPRVYALLAIALPIVLAACNKSGNGSGY